MGRIFIQFAFSRFTTTARLEFAILFQIKKTMASIEMQKKWTIDL